MGNHFPKPYFQGLTCGDLIKHFGKDYPEPKMREPVSRNNIFPSQYVVYHRVSCSTISRHIIVKDLFRMRRPVYESLSHAEITSYRRPQTD
jgi:hypothetical protein